MMQTPGKSELTLTELRVRPIICNMCNRSSDVASCWFVTLYYSSATCCTIICLVVKLLTHALWNPFLCQAYFAGQGISLNVTQQCVHVLALVSYLSTVVNFA